MVGTHLKWISAGGKHSGLALKYSFNVGKGCFEDTVFRSLFLWKLDLKNRSVFNLWLKKDTHMEKTKNLLLGLVCIKSNKVLTDLNQASTWHTEKTGNTVKINLTSVWLIITILYIYIDIYLKIRFWYCQNWASKTCGLGHGAAKGFQLNHCLSIRNGFRRQGCGALTWLVYSLNAKAGPAGKSDLVPVWPHCPPPGSAAHCASAGLESPNQIK